VGSKVYILTKKDCPRVKMQLLRFTSPPTITFNVYIHEGHRLSGHFDLHALQDNEKRHIFVVVGFGGFWGFCLCH
jgi:hypothetical protein